jgi:hypothetical protein
MEGTRTGEARRPPACDAEAFAWARGWPAIGWNVHGPTAAIAIGLAAVTTLVAWLLRDVLVQAPRTAFPLVFTVFVGGAFLVVFVKKRFD